MIRTRKRLWLCSVLLAGILCFIWGNSLLPAEISRAFSDWVKGLLFPASGAAGNIGSGLLRKIAHFTEFTALGMTLGWLFAMLEKKMYCPLFFGMGVACIDETIQMFVPGRGPGLLDVGIDACGVLMGMLLLNTAYFLKRKQTNSFGG